ncbi:Hsp20/alpha crystallin family protein [Halorarum salinum]|uniref:Hsp20 family protein n=1 Tax=Halorarum salinum TaxID=2743089 RepID=A0A7D5QM65_9EURY|nr:Hsp20 family protein [Halobaculum salinum]QLG63265.1 Hsp20 family protein [Halobaculum salinum]
MTGRGDRASGLKSVGRSAVSTVVDRIGRGMGKVQERTPLPYDLLESADAYLVVFDAPGATRSDVQVRFHEGAVEVRVDRFRDFREGFEMRFPGRGLALDGRAELPPHASVDASAASATLTDHGTLRVRVPKREAEGGTTVAIDAEEEAGPREDERVDSAGEEASETDEEWEKPVGEAVGMGEPEDESETLEESGGSDGDEGPEEFEGPDEYEESADGESDEE